MLDGHNFLKRKGRKVRGIQQETLKTGNRNESHHDLKHATLEGENGGGEMEYSHSSNHMVKGPGELSHH